MANNLVVAALAGALFLIIRLLFKGYLQRSPLDNIPGPPSPSFIVGSVAEFTDRYSWKRWRETLDTYGTVCRIQGMFGTRMLHVSDPKALYTILIKDGDLFPKTIEPISDMYLFLGPGLLTTNGAQHRKQRKLLNPVFSVAHLRDVSHIFYRIAHRLQKALEARAGQDGGIVDVNGWMSRAALEMLGQAGLGYSFDNFIDDSKDELGESVKMFFPVLSRVYPVAMCVPKAVELGVPLWLIKQVLEMVPSQNMRRMMAISDTMARRSIEIITEKKTALLKGDDALVHQVGEGKDIMSLLLKANLTASDAEKHTDEELIAQMSTFILGGMDTTSNALSRILHLLSQNPDVQDKLRAEIVEAYSGDDLAYDEVNKLPYLEAIIRETLRLFPPIQFIPRQAEKDMMLPLSKPIRGVDGTMLSEVPVTRGTPILAPALGCNTNKDLWGADALEWKPERWLEKLPQTLDDVRIPGIYSNLMTFAGGSRSCIGFKFSQLEMKVVLTVLLSKLKFEMTDRPIAWNSAAVIYPTTGEGSDRPEMFLKVTLVS
ncbi:cytochrome P450 [Lenzites betulinus]|nr:cytochrome P450 [Lenzites betulinus]